MGKIAGRAPPPGSVTRSIGGVGSAVRRSAVLAACLSTIVPGLGQIWLGEGRRGILIAGPFLVLVAVGVVAWSADAPGLVGTLLRPEALTGLLAGDLALLAYRAFAIVDAYRLARLRWPDPGALPARVLSVAALVVLLVANGGLHGAIAYAGVRVVELETALLAGQTPGDEILPSPEPPPEPSPVPAVPSGPGQPGPSSSAQPTATFPRGYFEEASPSPTARPAWMWDRRLDVLLVGGDAGPDRWGLRTDTMILVSADVATGRSALFGIPRNMVNVPLPAESADAFECRCFPRLLNALYMYAIGHPGSFPGGDNRGFRAVAGAIEELTGVDLDGVAIIDINGFVRLIDALGGLTITVTEPVFDARYPKPDGTGLIEIYVPAGRQQMDGFTALAYARSRHQDSDYGRMARQQLVLLALQRQLKPCAILADLPSVLDSVQGTLVTTFTPDDLPDLLRLAAKVSAERIERFAFTPPAYPEHLGEDDVARIRDVVGRVFERPEPAASPPGPAPDEEPC
jgi:LCP family protein required for cell wall assembly